MTRVLVAEDIGASGVELLRSHFDVDTAFDDDGFDLDARIGDYDGLLIRSATKVTGDLIAQGGRSCARSAVPAWAWTTWTWTPRPARASWWRTRRSRT